MEDSTFVSQGGQPTAGTAQEKKVPMVQIYIYVFLKIADLESL